MEKKGKEGIVCTYCDKPAIPDTDPPVCADCQMIHKEAQDAAQESEPSSRSLKELM